jgi:beta-lactamase class A
VTDSVNAAPNTVPNPVPNPAPNPAPGPGSSPQNPALSAFVDDLPGHGTFSLWSGPLTGDAWFEHRADEQHYAASTMKLALVMAAYREAEAGRLDLDATVPVHNDFRSRGDGATFHIDEAEDSDPEPWRRRGNDVALRWLCSRAIVRSSNLATNLVMEQVGPDAVGGVLDLVGATNTTITRGIEDYAAREAGLQNLVTARDLAKTLQALHTTTVLSPAGCAEVLAILEAQQINDAIPVRLPPGTRVAHKSGWIEGISHDAGIITPADGSAPFVFVMCTTSDLPEQPGLDLIAAGAAAAWSDRRV